MKHESAVGLVEDLLRGELTDPAFRDVLAHVSECEDCRTLSETYIALAEGLHTGGSSTGHPSSETIVEHALGRDAFDRDRRERVAQHLRSCPTCTMEVEATRGAEQECSRPETAPVNAAVPVPPGVAWARWALAAAVLPLVVLSPPLYRGLVELPRVSSELEETRQRLDRLSSWTGTGSLTLLQAPLRSTDSQVVSVEVADGQPTIALAADPGLLDAYAGDSRIRFSIRGGRDAVVWSQELPVHEVRGLTARSAVVTLFVPSRQLTPGSAYVLEVAHRTATAEQPIFAAPFAVVRAQSQPPAATKAPQ